MDHPTAEQIVQAYTKLSDYTVETPVIDGHSILGDLPFAPSKVSLKLELLQKTGSFKIRGALNLMRTLSSEQLKKGVTAFSAGNHAMAVAYAAKILGTSAKVV